MIDPGLAEQAGTPVGEQGDLVGDTDLERVHRIGGDPADIAVSGLVGELDALSVDRGRHLRHLDRFLGGTQGGGLGQVNRGGEPPGAIQDHPHREPQVIAVEQGHQVAVGQADLLPPDTFGAEVGMLCAEVGGALQGGGRQLVQRVGGELGVDPAVAAARSPASGVISHDWQLIPRRWACRGTSGWAERPRACWPGTLRRTVHAPRPSEVPAEMSRSTLVTGGNRGIGLAIARRLAAGGDTVTVTSRSGEKVAGLATVACDVRDTASVNDAFAKVEAEQGPVEVVVANAGITHDQLLALMGEDDFTSVLDTNLTGAYRVARRAVRPMMRMRRGRLIFMSSVVGLLGSAGQANYAASKSGLVGLARSLARELASRNITCNVVAPGFVDTDMTASLPDERKAAILAQVPLGRLAAADEVAGVVAFLAGDDAAYVTGAVIPVDGGLGMGH